MRCMIYKIIEVSFIIIIKMGNTNLTGEQAYYFNEKNMLGEGAFAEVFKVKKKENK